MNIIDAAEAAHAGGATVISRLRPDGKTLAVKFTFEKKAICAFFSSDCRLSYALPYWSHSVMDVLSDDWEVFRSEKFAIPAEKAMDPKPDFSGPLYQMAIKSDDFRDTLRMADDDQVYLAADTLGDLLHEGAPVKMRLKAIMHEIARREKGRKV